jgi:hypothetical protein
MEGFQMRHRGVKQHNAVALLIRRLDGRLVLVLPFGQRLALQQNRQVILLGKRDFPHLSQDVLGDGAREGTDDPHYDPTPPSLATLSRTRCRGTHRPEQPAGDHDGTDRERCSSASTR